MKLYKLDMILCFPILQRQKNAFMTTINASKNEYYYCKNNLCTSTEEKAYFLRFSQAFEDNVKNRKHFEQKSNSTSPPQSTTELILFKLKKSSLCMSVDLLLHL